MSKVFRTSCFKGHLRAIVTKFWVCFVCQAVIPLINIILKKKYSGLPGNTFEKCIYWESLSCLLLHDLIFLAFTPNCAQYAGIRVFFLQLKFCPYSEKNGSEKSRTLAYLTQCLLYIYNKNWSTFYHVPVYYLCENIMILFCETVFTIWQWLLFTCWLTH